MQIKAPKNGFIKQLLVDDGLAVKKDQELLIFGDEDEQHALARLQAAQRMAEIGARILADDYLKRQRRMVEINIEIAAKYEEFATLKLKFAQANEDFSGDYHVGIASAPGESPKILVSQAEAALQKCRGESEKARLALDVFEFNVTTARDRQAVLEEQLKTEMDFVHTKAKALLIRAPIHGTLRLAVAVGSFSKCGQVLAEIQ